MNDKRAQVRKLAELLDTRFRTPIGAFGWDGILGLIPGVGDLITNAISLYVIALSAKLGASPAVLLRMGGNILVENVVDTIPIFGNLFDFFWKANTKNMILLDRFLDNPGRTQRNSRWVVALVLLLILLAVALIVAGGIYLLRLLFGALQSI